MSDHPDTVRFSPAQTRVLDLVLDELVPPSDDGTLPGAGALALAGDLEEALLQLPAVLEMIAESLTALDQITHRRHGTGFAERPRHDRQTLLDELASTEHAFPPLLLLHVYAAYYRHPRVVAALGLDPRPPHPHGYEMVPDDLTLLDAVRRRGPRFRSC